jgi:hypothetical protein
VARGRRKEEIMNRHWKRLVSLHLLMLAAGLLAACGGGPGTLNGLVVDATGTAVPRLDVGVYSLQDVDAIDQGRLYQKGSLVQEQATGADGRFSFSLEPGRYIVQVRQDGVDVGSQLVEVKAGRTVTVRLQLAGSSRGAVYMARMFSRGVSPWI